MSDEADRAYHIRSFRPSDAAACQALYTEGLISGHIADNDTGLDIDDIQSVYMETQGSHFWVAETRTGEIVGMIGVQQHDADSGEIRRLRVRKDSRRRGIGIALVETALKHCRQQNHLKVTLDTYMDREAALRLFERFGFRLSRTRQVGDREFQYFYLDLYTREQSRRAQS